MHEPKFTKKCYDCTNRFLCWTNREKLPEIVGLPQCSKCETQLEPVGEPYEKRIVDSKMLMVKVRCPEKRWYNLHTIGRCIQITDTKWIHTY